MLRAPKLRCLCSPIAAYLGPAGLIRALAVDHNPLMREGLARLVRMQPDTQHAGSVATAEEAVRIYIEQRPDVTLMDLDLPSKAALGAIRKIRARDARARIIGLTTSEPDAAWARALCRRSEHLCSQGTVKRQISGTNSKRAVPTLTT
jgi:DNA-binding NarL/FixJ family response regulator